MMRADIRDTELYREVEATYQALRRPGAGHISDASDLSVSPDGRHAVFTGVVVEKLDGGFPTRVCQIDVESGVPEY